MKNTLIKLIIVICLGIIQTNLFAQQDPQYSQYMFNTLAINPAYAGSRDVINVTMLGRRQWVIKGAPQSATLALDMPVLNEKIGLGLLVFNDQIGLIANTGFYGCYSQRIRLTNAGTLSLGLTAGGTQFSASLSDVLTYTQNDPAFASNYNNIKPNAGLGIYYATDKWYTGFSMPRLVNNKLGIVELAQQARQFRHYFLMAGFVKHINSYLVIKPSLLGKAVSNAPMQLDLNLNFWFYDKFSIGTSYRTKDAILGMIEILPSQRWRIGYAYDLTTSRFRYNNNNNGSYVNTGGSHEVMLRYEFANSSNKILSPRYF